MNSEKQDKLLETLISIARSMELMLERIENIEERLIDICDALPDEEGEEEPP